MTAEVILALTIWFEARGEGNAGMTAVASVVYNRACDYRDSHERASMDAAILAVCLKPRQFSCWKADWSGEPAVSARPRTGDAQYAFACELARTMLNGEFAPTTTATHYHTANTHPYWADSMLLVGKLGNHWFYEES